MAPLTYGVVCVGKAAKTQLNYIRNYPQYTRA